MGVCGWLHCQATLSRERNPVTRDGVNISCRRGVLIGCGRSGDQDRKLVLRRHTWDSQLLGCGRSGDQDRKLVLRRHTWGTRLLTVLKKTALNLINLFNITTYPSVSLSRPCLSTKMIWH